MPLTPSTRLGAYEITAPLGAGGMGEVYRARDTRIGREVAVKVLPGTHAADTDRLRRFEQEARAAGALNHPNVLTLHDVGRHDGTSYLVCELLEGETLRERLSRGRVKPAEALDYAVQVARGLGAAHDKGIVHRDLKPENVFLTRDGRVKVLDFGLAKLVERPAPPAEVTQAETATRHTEPGVVLGTAGYMSPEQVRGLPADHRSDIFAFGAILHEMLSGSRAFAGASSVETMNAVLTVDPPPAPVAEAPPLLAKVVRRCLEKAPEKRFQSAHDLAFALEASAPGASTASTSASRGWWPWLAVALASGVVLGLAPALLRGRAPAAPARTLRASILAPHDASFVTLNQRLVLAPDGRHIAFLTRNRRGQIWVWVRDLVDGSARPIAESDIFASPFWSPDGKTLGFVAGGKLRTVDLASGAQREVYDVQRMRGASWSRRGDILFAKLPTSGLSRIPLAGGTPVDVTRLDAARGEYSHRWPYFLPDDRHFVFLALSRSAAGQFADLYLGDLDGGAPRLLIRDASNAEYVPSGHLLFGRQGSLLAVPFDASRLEVTGEPMVVSREVTYMKPAELTAFSVAPDGMLAYLPPSWQESRLRWLDRTGATVGEIDTRASNVIGNAVRVSPDGRAVAFVQTDPQNNNGFVWAHDLERQRSIRVTPVPRFFQGVVWSEGGRSVLYSAVQTNDVREKAMDGTADEKVLLDPPSMPLALHDASPDGRTVLYAVLDPAQGWDLWWVSRGGGSPGVVLQTRFNETEGRFSSDGRWMAFTSDASGRQDVYVMAYPPSPGGRTIPVSAEGGRRPSWRSDGKELYYLSPDGKLMVVDVEETPGGIDFSAPRPLFEFPPEALEFDRFTYDAAPDGRRFLANVPAGEVAAPSVTIVTNWMAGLGKER